MHLIRGSGVEGLGGMRWVSGREPAFHHPRQPGSNVRAARLVRPLLNVRRNEILRYLAAHHLNWCDDTSNRDTHLRRNYVRHTLAPKILEINPSWVEAAGRTAQILAAEAERIRDLDRRALTGLLIDPPAYPQSEEPAPDRIVMDLARWQSLDLATQRGTLRLALALLAAESDADFDTINALVWTLRENPSSRSAQPLSRAAMWTLSGVRLSLHHPAALPFQPDHPYLDKDWRRHQDRLAVPVPGRLHGVNGWRLVAEVGSVDELPADWRSRATPWHAYLDAQEVQAPVLTVPQPGMTIAPLGMGGKHKGLGDLFTDNKVPAALRSGWPLIIAPQQNIPGRRQDGELVWVCGIQIAHPARLTDRSTRFLYLRWEKEK
jgi:tRNA(Ile)-lysidine synthase